MSLTVRNIKTGEVIPKIAVPIISRTKAEILSDAEKIAGSSADIAEWRVDFYDEIDDVLQISVLAEEIRNILCEKLLLFTCRTFEEGGEAKLDHESYRKLLDHVISCECVDLIDVEIDTAAGLKSELIEKAHAKSIAVVMSHHNFKITPESDMLLEKYAEMSRSGADILKIAVMPNSIDDVDRMITVSRNASKRLAQPIIAIVMGEKGRCTRIACEAVGSCITFGSIGGASAPGQIDAEELREMLLKVRGNISEFLDAQDSAELNNLITEYCN